MATILRSHERRADLIRRGKSVEKFNPRCYDVIVRTNDRKPYGRTENEAECIAELIKRYGASYIRILNMNQDRWDANREANIYNARARRLQWKSVAVVELNRDDLKAEKENQRLKKLLAPLNKKTGFGISSYVISHPIISGKQIVSWRISPYFSLDNKSDFESVVEAIGKIRDQADEAVRYLRRMPKPRCATTE